MDCASYSCYNNGTCNVLIGYFTCDRMSEYTGETCTIDINDCDPNPCSNPNPCGNNGGRTDLVNNFMCACITGSTDDSCTTIIDDYSPNPYPMELG